MTVLHYVFMEVNKQIIDVVKLSNYVRPEIKEVSGKEYVLNGDKNSFYSYIIDRYNGSPTNRAIIDSYAKYIYGKGLTSKQQSVKPMQFAQVLQKLSKKDLRNICQDYAIFSEASYECIYKNNELQSVKHVPKNQILPNKMNDDGDIEGYWYCLDFNNPRKYTPVLIPKWEQGNKNGSYIKVITSYNLGKTYFTDPCYMAGLPYAELEERVANFCINYITNDLSIGKIINMNQGKPESQEVRDAVKKALKGGAGNEQAGNVFINWNDNKDTAITFDNMEIVDAYQQFEYLNKEATSKLLVAHKAVSGRMFGIDSASGFSSNADETQIAFDETMINVIQPMQEVILDDIMDVFTDAGYSIDLDFIPLRQKEQHQTVALSKGIDFTDPMIASGLIELGEIIEDDYELIDEIEQKEAPKLTETALKVSLAKEFSSFPSVTSEQDTSLFKIRYKYAGNSNPERDFCQKLMKADKVYRKEDIELAGSKVVNAGLGKDGKDTYSIWLYKGGVNCKHFWQRQIYLRKDNGKLSVNDARRMILELDPKDRPLAKWQENNPLVAQPAQASNDYFKAN